jgi:hypothetical protein
MRVPRSIQVLTIFSTLTTFAACRGSGDKASAQSDSAAAAMAPAPVAAAPVAAPEAAPAPAPANVNVDVRWDSGPLDLAYRNAHVALEAQHAREIAKPSPSETPTQRARRQTTENQALEARYTAGKTAHSRTLPPAER